MSLYESHTGDISCITAENWIPRNIINTVKISKIEKYTSTPKEQWKT